MTPRRPRKRPATRHGPRTPNNTDWTRQELGILKRLDSPAKVQAFLDSVPYSADAFSRCPRRVLKDGKANCFDGALLAAAALRRLGHPALLLDMRAVRDDDHVLAVFRQNGLLGAIAKSNFVGLRFREPIFRNPRELVLSYFEDYYNSDGEKTLRAYSGLLDLRPFDRLSWTFHDEPLDAIAERLDAMRHFPVANAKVIASLNRMDERSLQAGMLGVNRAGLYRPGKT